MNVYNQGSQAAGSDLNNDRSYDGTLFANAMGSEANGTGTVQKLFKIDPSIKDISIKDLDRDGYFGPQDVPDDYVVPTSSQAAAAVAQDIASDPKARVVFIGETHSDSATRRFIDVIKATNQQLASTGRHAIAVIETPSTPELDKLIEDYQGGKLSEDEFLDKGSKILDDVYMDAYKNHGIPLGMEKDRPAPLDRQYWRNRLKEDVVSYNNEGIKVVLADDGRFIPGKNRDEYTANKILKVANENPDSVLVCEYGLLHSQETPGIQLVNDYKVDGGSPANSWEYKGAVVSKGDEKNPAASRVAKELGGQAVLTFAMDDAFSDEQDFWVDDWYPIEEGVEKPVGKVVPIHSFDYHILSWDPKETNNPNTSIPVKQDPLIPSGA